MRSNYEKAKYALDILRSIEHAIEEERPRRTGETLNDYFQRTRTDVAHVVSIYCAETIDDRLGEVAQAGSMG